MLIVPLASCVNYTLAFVSALFLHLELLHFMVIVLALSFLAGAFFSNVEKSILNAGLSMIAGAVITLVLYLSPLLVYGEAWMIDIVIDRALGVIAPHLLFGAIPALLGSMLGSFLLSRSLQ